MRVLVTVASKYGATQAIGDVVASTLVDAGLEVMWLAPDDVEQIDDVDAVVLGSAVYMGRWMAEARAFVTRFESDLASRPVWLFSSGPLGARDLSR